MTNQKRKPGRPRESKTGETRDHAVVGVALTRSEFEFVTERAERLGISKAEALRRNGLRGYRPEAAS